MIPAVIAWAVIPWGGLVEIADQVVSIAVLPVNIGVIYILAVSSLAVYGIVLGSYGSNNKYSFLGGLRATAQMLSYEIPMGVIVLIMIMVYATPDAGAMSIYQTGGFGLAWGILMHPLLAILFFITSLAETNRAPFDLAEAEQELVGGFHTEYGSMRWALFFLGEYMNMITTSAFFCVLFLGGWDLVPFLGLLPPIADGWFLEGTEWAWLGTILLTLVKTHVFFGKILVLLFIMMWVRWSLPRFRYDQLMSMAWRGLIPITIGMLLVSTLIVYADGAWWWYTIANVAVAVVAASVGMILPQTKVNRKVPLAGSRFSPLPMDA
jgi:NADH-quinone oxidoreductase subunit H